MDEPQGIEQTADLVGITEAAQRLGVSERTVYRMLRSGKLKRVISSDEQGKYVRLKVSEKEKTFIALGADLSVTSDKTADSRQEDIHKAVREKDAQIAQLLEQQRELQQQIGRLQEQMFELARLVLSQNAAAQANPAAVSVKPSQEARTGLFARFRRERDKE
jgi:excisionase family DNA binding protein